MNLGTKILTATLSALALATVVSLLVQRSIIRNQGIDLTRETMEAVILEAENVRDTISAMNQAGAFDRKKLLKELEKTSDFRNTTLYTTIPVVAAWQAISTAADKQGYKFRVVKNRPRNPANEPDVREQAILRQFDSGQQKEFFEINKEHDEIVFARPIVLSQDCLACHGDPANSPTGDGKDILGFQMENWRAGEVHGAFILSADLERIDTVVQAGFMQTVLWLLPIVVVIGTGVLIMTQRLVIAP
ncbi:MAG: c-type heme family protein, partial [Verrucomicrobiota bacterium]